MKRIIKIIILSCFIFMIVVVAGISGYEARVAFEKWQFHNELEDQKEVRSDKFAKEAERMQAFAKQSHEKCPSQVTLKSKDPAFGDIQMPAYPNLSDIYVYIQPKVFKLKRHGWAEVKKETLQKIKKYTFREKGKNSTNEVLLGRLPNLMPPLFIEALEKSLAYCGVGQEPLKIKFVDKIQHKNLEQRNALTIVVGSIYASGSTSKYSYPSLISTFNLYVSQYIPRWGVFSKGYGGGMANDKYYKNDPFHIKSIHVRDSYNLFSLSLPKEESIKNWLIYAWSQLTLNDEGGWPKIWGPKSVRVKYKADLEMRQKKQNLIKSMFYRGIGTGPMPIERFFGNKQKPVVTGIGHY